MDIIAYSGRDCEPRPEFTHGLSLPARQLTIGKDSYISSVISGYNSKNDTVFICEGPNNALLFVEIGHSAIGTFGATNLPTPDLSTMTILIV